MSRWLRGPALGFALLTSVGGGLAEAQERALITVRQLFDQAHRLEVPVGTEAVWADPHFERVWFPTGAENPTVECAARLIDRLIHYYRTEHHRKPSCFCEGKEG